MKKNSILSLALLSGALFASAPAMAQDMKVTMTTGKAVGSSMALMVNHTYNGVTVDWGDNQPQTYKNQDAKPFVITGEVKGNRIVITGDEAWELLQCSGCELTELDLTQARGLRSLYCQNNKLQALDLKGMNKLTDLNCSGNQLSEITYTNASNPCKDLSSIEYYNVAGNQLSGSNGKFVMGTRSDSAKTLSIVNISNNKFNGVTLQYAPNIQVLKGAHNEFASIDLSKSGKIESLLLNDNQIAVARTGNGRFNLKLPSSSLKQLVIDNNQIDSLNIASYGSIKDLSCKNNGMKVLVLPQESHINTYDVCNNNLNFSALPTATQKPVICNFLPQDSIDIYSASCVVSTEDNTYYIPVCPSYSERNDPQYALDLSKYRATANNTNAIRTTMSWYAIQEDGTSVELTKGSNADADYSYSLGITAFYKLQKRVYAILKQSQYGFELPTNSIAVGEENASVPSAIDQIAQDGGLTITAGHGVIIMNSPSPVSVRIYSIDGKSAWSGIVKSDDTVVNLSKGIYIVNGKKVIL